MNEQIQLTVVDEIRVYEKIEQEIANTEIQLTDLKRILKDSERRVIDAFEREGMADVSYNGRRWKPEAVNTITCVGEDGGQKLIDYLVEHVEGARSKVKQTMHWASRDAIAKETFIDDDGNINIPAELDGFVAPYQDVKLAKRKV